MNKKESIFLLLGDLSFLILALWITLLVRYFQIPSKELFTEHLIPFALLFIVWIIIFFIAGLYEKHITLLKNHLPSLIFNTQIINSTLAVVFFYFIPYFGITPKTNLFIYLIISSALIFTWRLYLVPSLGFKKRQNTILIGSGEEMKDLRQKIETNPSYGLKLSSFIDLNEIDEIDFQDEVLNKIYSENIHSIIIDLKNEKIADTLPHLYNLIFSNVKFMDMYKVYEDIFDRIPLSLVGYNWFLENISSSSHLAYDFLKRLMDIIISLTFGTISLVFYPFVFLAIKIDDGRAIFIVQERVGQGGRIIKMVKFRSMKSNDAGVWVQEDDNRITKVGRFLRKSRIDELPQFWNLLKGDVSLIGPRPDIINLGKKLTKEIPYYTIRNLVKPGLSGWAQIKQDAPPQSVAETKLRLSYDLYYIKNRSFLLDLKIFLKTFKTLISRTGL